MKNQFRTSQWMAIRRHINKCVNFIQLSTLKEIVLKYHQDKKKHSGELLFLYIQREAALNPEPAYSYDPTYLFEDENLTKQHRKLSL